MTEILLIVVIYNKKIEKMQYLSTMQDIDVLIYDNSVECQEVSSNYHYIHDPSNPGVSRAYNEGIKLAKKLNKKYVILLDQDTKFNLEDLKKYSKAKEKYGDSYLYAPIIIGKNKIYSPFIEKKNNNSCQTMEEFNYIEIYNLRNKSLINSGLMIPIELLKKIGHYNDKIKLDFSDIYFVDKYKGVNNEIVLIDLYVEHSISGDEGKDKNRELHRFKYYCNGAREVEKSISDRPRIHRMIFFRTLRLMVKYKSFVPIFIAKEYYYGGKTI